MRNLIRNPIAIWIILIYIVLNFILFCKQNEAPPIFIIFFPPINYDKMFEYVVDYVKSTIKKIFNCWFTKTLTYDK